MKRSHVLAAQSCPICGTSEKTQCSVINGNTRVECQSCGTYDLSRTAADVIPNWDLPEHQWTAIAYQLRRITDRAEVPLLTDQVVRALLDSAKLPDPLEIEDGLILWLGSHALHAGDAVNIGYSEFKSILGAVDHKGFNYLTTWIVHCGYFTGVHSKVLSGPQDIFNCALSPKGWKRYRELQTAQKQSRDAFIAMKYNDGELDIAVKNHFSPAVAAAGFRLRRLDEEQPAGLIDDQLRVAIRTSRFLICDLTHANRGAYWEAGFAEGLGKPVIYTCRRDVFEDPKHADHPHFDTSHLVTIVWDPSHLQPAANKLKATIRATLPSEAILQD